MKVVNDIICALDNKEYSAAVFVDLSKAFDSVDHPILLERLRNIGLSETCVSWFSSYCSGCLQTIRMEGLLSAPLPLHKGVPQGSILGPTLFNININNITHAVYNAHIHLYADDTIVYTSGPSLNDALSNLQTAFSNIQHAFSDLLLSLNTKKTKRMIFNKNLPQIQSPINIISLDGSIIDFVNNYKYLGIWLDPCLSFETHINSLLTTVKNRIGFLYRNRSSFTRSAKHLLVKMTVLPIFDYGDMLYRSTSKSLLHKLDTIYHTAIHFVTDAPFTTHHCTLYSLVNWPSLHSRRQTHWYLFIYKTIIGLTPAYLRSLLITRHISRSLRNSNLIHLLIPKACTVFGRY
uniref:Reverse transcriptase domain-containing protein n=1 Tax=Stegastes partitus TaxID=144197 RepID=A0A3B5BCC6_9TELE